jgi:hypothetical protein
MAKRKSLDFLPSVFKTPSNQRFLNATIDQLIQEPSLKKIYGYIGQQDQSSVFQPTDYYISESDKYAQFYQLEPGVVIKKRDFNSNTYKVHNVYGYQDLLNQFVNDGGLNNNHDRLFKNTYYNYNGFVDLDKLTNYRQYYWAPNGPLTVDVTAGGVPLEKEFFIHRTSYISNNQTEIQSASLGKTGYTIDGYNKGVNPTLILRRGGQYTFNVGQAGHKFWIQTETGTSGVSSLQSNISTRDILGVQNNGSDVGNVTFSVPLKTAQDSLINLPSIQDIDMIVHAPYDAIQGQNYDNFIKSFSLDGVRSFDTKLINIIWPNDSTWGDVPLTQRGGIWQVTVDNNEIIPGNLAATTNATFNINSNSIIVDNVTNIGIGQFIVCSTISGIPYGTVVTAINGNAITLSNVVNINNLTAPVYFYNPVQNTNYRNMKLQYVSDWNNGYKVFVKQGDQYGHTYSYKDAFGQIVKYPTITAPLDTLYYVDADNPLIYGEIRIVDPDPASVLNVDNIIGRDYYTSPNGVEFTSGLKIKFTGIINPSTYQDREYVVENVGKSIRLIAWDDLATPENINQNLTELFSADNIGYDTELFDQSLNAPEQKDYITINRSSVDGNAWSRNNRWFHRDVLQYAATFTGQTYIFDSNLQAKRPIVEFFPDLKLFNYGTNYAGSVSAVDSITTNAFLQVEGQNEYAIKVSTHAKDVENYTSDGVLLQNGLTVIFTNDADPIVRSTIYQVETIRPRTDAATYYPTTTQSSSIGSNTLYISDLTGLQVGMKVAGTNIAAGTVITSFNYNDINSKTDHGGIVYINNSVLATVAQGTVITFDNTTLDPVTRAYANFYASTYKTSVTNSNALYINNINSLTIGQAVFGAGIPTNTTITSVDKTNGIIYISNDVTQDIPAFTSIGFNNGATQVHLVPVKTVSNGDNVLITNGITKKGYMYYYVDGVWYSAQQRDSRPQFPLFDMVDNNGISFTDTARYPSTTFSGSKLFGYAIGNGKRDSELGFPLQYKTIGNIGDIVFQNYYSTDTFTYSEVTTPVNIGYVPVIVGWNDYTFANGWSRVNDKSKQYICLTFTASTSTYNNFDLGVVYENSYFENNLFVYVNGVLQDKKVYTLKINETTSILSFNNDLVVNDRLFIKIYGTSSAYKQTYTMPRNITNNSDNTDFTTITLGQIRNHVIELGDNTLDLVGLPAGENNFRDIDYTKIGGKLIQHSASARPAALMFSNPDVDPIRALTLASEQYRVFKAQLFDLISNRQFTNSSNYRECLDIILNEFAQTSNSGSNFYYSDMIAGGKNYILNTYTIQDTSYKTFNTVTSYDNVLSTYKSVLIYLNNMLLINGIDYTLSGLTITLSNNLKVNRLDTLSVYEYSSTLGCNIPSTPSKLGLYPKFVPEITVDDTYLDSQNVIIGHDGSVIIAWGDYRDNILLEYEKRVYNNISIEYDNNSDYSLVSVQPGAFRSTGYDLNEWTQLLSSSYLSWSGVNNIDIFTNTTTNDNLFSFNYSQGTDRVFGKNVPGYWRGIYNYFYDTDRPHTNPWEMLGFTVKPTWWEYRYGPAPYSSENLTLWNDLELGLIYNGSPKKSYINSKYARPGLSKIIPVDEHGVLLPPILATLESYDVNTASDNWRIGDCSPQETSWRRSSMYPFAVQIAWCLARPAEYCALKYNTRDVQYNAKLDQILNVKTNSRVFNYSVTGDSEYIPGLNVFIRELLVYNNLDVNANWIEVAANSTFNLVYKMSGYSDKSYLTIVADQVSPQSTNVSVLVPQENYQLKVTKSAPVARAVYSAVIVQKTTTGYQINGFDKSRPYFLTIPSRVNANNYGITVGNDTGVIYRDAEDTVTSYPYGTIFNNKQQVVDFLVSYGRYLEGQGFVFNTVLADNVTVSDWTLSVKEFLFWEQQQWGNDTVIGLTPAGTSLTYNNVYGVVDTISNDHNYTKVVDSDGTTLNGNDYRVYREDNTFSIELKNNQKGIHILDLSIVQYEHTIIFDNVTVFNDILYDEQIGSRQFRLRLDGAKTQGWNGSLYAPGFIINYSDISNWNSYTDYYKGDIVLYKKQYYSAQNFIPGTAKFNTNDWYKINGDLLKKQLIPNMASGAAQFVDFYNPDSADLNTAADIQSKHAVGFQDRQYFTDLGLDRVSQYKFYLGMINQKGSQAVINAFLRNQQNRIDSDIRLNEQWAVKLGSYGGTEHTDKLEFNIGGTTTINNQYLFEFIDNQDPRSPKYNSIKQSDLLISPRNYTTDIFAQTDYNKQIVATTGPVLIANTNATVYDISKIYNISKVNAYLGESSTIWIAADGDNQWGVYRLSQTDKIFVTNVHQSSPSELTFTTNIPHHLSKLDYIMLKNAKITTSSRSTGILDIGGFYRVSDVSGNTFSVKITQDTTIASGTLNAVLLKLINIRFDTVRDFGAFTPARGWQNNEIVYIDNGPNGYDVKKNTDSWSYFETRSPVFSTPADQFGTSISISNKQNLAVVGATGKGSTGQVYVFESEQDNTWHEFIRLTPDSRDVGFGSTVQFNDNNIVAISAPNTNNKGSVYIASVSSQRLALDQVIHYDNLYVTTSIASSNSNVYVSGTGQSLSNFAIGMTVVGAGIPNGTKIANLKTTGSTYNIIGLTKPVNVSGSESIAIYPNLVPGSTFGTSVCTSKDGNWLFVGEPTVGKVFVYKYKKVDTDTNTVIGDNNNMIFGFPNSAQLKGLSHHDVSVRVNGVLKMADLDYIKTPSQDSITFVTAPALGANVSVTYENYFQEVTSFTTDDPEVIGFGSSVSCSADGRHVVVGAKSSNATLDVTYTNAGKAYIFERAIENFVANGQANSFTTTTTFNNPSITIDGVAASGTFYNANNTVVLNSYPISDSIVAVETNAFIPTKILTSDYGQTDSNFGATVKLCPIDCSVYVSATGWNYNSKKNGAVFRFVNVPKLYGVATGTVAGFTMPAGLKLYINDFLVTFIGGGAQQCVNDINRVKIPGVTASLLPTGEIQIVSDINIADNKLRFRNGYGNPLNSLGIDPWQLTQKIFSPILQDTEEFGNKIDVSPDAGTLVIGATLSNNKTVTTIDGGKTSFDAKTVRFVDIVYRSGAAHVYEYQSSATETPDDQGTFVFAKLLSQNTISSYDKFATGVAISKNFILIGAPNGKVLGNPAGVMHVYYNKNGDRVWNTIREGGTNYDSRMAERVYLYNSTTSKLIADLPIIDLQHNRLPGSAESYIDYTINYDPAVYNKVPTTVSFSYDTKNNWGKEKVGTLWWDTNTIKYYDNSQGTTLDQFNNWGLAFPGSKVSIYEWIESNLSPKDYAAVNPNHLPLYTVNDVYSVRSEIDQSTGLAVSKYYFWIRNSVSVPADNSRPSAFELQNNISSPRNFGEPFAAIINKKAIAIYNCQTLVGDDTNLVIEYKNQIKPQLTHTEWTMFDDGTDLGVAEDFINKIRDSMALQDGSGRTVPDPKLPIGQRYGTSIRPRQSVFSAPFAARKLFVSELNYICSVYPMALVRSQSIKELNNAEPEPTVDLYDIKVDTNIELGYLDKILYKANTRVLVKNDTSIGGGWALYYLNVNVANENIRTWNLYRVQKYDITKYWNYTDWFSTKYNAKIPPTYTVDTESQISSLSLNINDIIYVKNSNEGGWKLVLVNSDNLELLAQQNATISFNSKLYSQSASGQGFESSAFEITGYATDCNLEFAAIFDIVTNSMLTNEYRTEFKTLIKLMIDTIANQHLQTDWLMKTSFIDLYHRVRGLDPLPVYLPQPEKVVTDFFAEVKPYHTKLKQYVARYDNSNNVDVANTGVSDFDLQPYYNAGLKKYRSPQLGNILDSDQLANQSIYQPWVNHHTYQINRIDIYNGGSGYTAATTVTIVGDGNGATAKALVLGGTIYSIIITNPGSGYTYATVQIRGLGQGAMAYAILNDGLVRNINTIVKFDRYTYFNNIQDWSPNTHYAIDTVVVNNAEPYRVIIDHTSGDIFDFVKFLPLIVKVWYPNTEYTQYDIIIYKNTSYIANANFTSNTVFDTNNLSVYNGLWLDNAADRVWAYYSPLSGMAGRDLAQVMVGMEYSGVGVIGQDFNQTPGFDIGNYDSLVYDLTSTVDENGILDVYGIQALDSKISSSFTDTGLGIRPEDINIDGGKFVDQYNSHAPEELIPGIIQDTLDITVRTLPQSTGNPDIKVFTAKYNSEATISFDPKNTGVTWPIGGIEKFIVVDRITGTLTESTDYVVDWQDLVIKLVNTPNPLTSYYIIMLGSTGLSSVFDGEYVATGTETDFDIPNSTLNSVEQAYVKVNGKVVSNWMLVNKQLNGRGILSVRFDTPPNANDYVQVHLYAIPLGIRAYMEATEQSFKVSSTPTYPADYSFVLDNTAEYIEPISSFAIVRLNNSDLIPPQQSYYVGDGITSSYNLTSSLNKNISIISDAELLVILNGVIQINGVDYTVTRDPANLVMPVINFTKIPPYNSRIVFSDSSSADFKIYSTVDDSGKYTKSSLWLNSALTIPPNSTISVLVMGNHDTTDLYTKMFSGSSVPLTIVGDTGFESFGFEVKAFDNEITSNIITTATFSSGSPYITVASSTGILIGQEVSGDGIQDTSKVVAINGTAISLSLPTTSNGSGVTVTFAGTSIVTPTYILPRAINNINQIYVTVKDPGTIGGRPLIPYQDYILQNSTTIVLSAALNINPNSIITVRMFGNSIRQNAATFRIFKDIRDNTRYYSIKPSKTTRLVKDLVLSDSWIYCEDVTKLQVPDPKNNRAGVVLINGERITYGYVDVEGNRLGNLRRGTAGTGAATVHQSGTDVYDSSFALEIPNSADTIVTLPANKDAYITNSYNATIHVAAGGTIKQGKLFTNIGESIQVSNTAQAQFIRES